MGEGNLVDSALYLAPLLVIDAIGIDDLLHIIISKCGELERERVVFVGEMEFFRVTRKSVWMKYTKINYLPFF